MARGVTLAMLAILGSSPAGAVAQQRGWLVSLTGGYAHGIGDFGGKGSVSGTAFALRPVGGNVDVGVELGYHRLGTNTTRLPDLYGPGTTYREDFTRSAWQATAAVRLRLAASRIRP
jgi:hypothetical protein